MQNVRQKITQITRVEKQYAIASLMNKLHDLQLCEDSFQDAIIAALITWPKNGIPTNARAWLITTAHRKALDVVRRGQNFRSKSELIQYETQLNADENELKANLVEDKQILTIMPNPHLSSPDNIDDEQLKLMFLCCHPALNKQAQVALALKIIGGLTTDEIAAAYLTSKKTIAQRLVRAKQKIKTAGIAFKMPDTTQFVSRIDNILSAIYLIYNESYVATNSKTLIKTDLAQEATELCRNVIKLLPKNNEALGLLALMLLQIARTKARTNKNGEFVALQDQDRSLWQQTLIDEGKNILLKALSGSNLGKYQILAAINCCHADAKTYEKTDWLQIKLLYHQLYRLEPSPIVMLNILVADSMTDFYDMQLQNLLYHKLLEIGQKLQNYQPYFAVKADFLTRLQHTDKAIDALKTAISLTNNEIETKFLQRKIYALKASR